MKHLLYSDYVDEMYPDEEENLAMFRKCMNMDDDEYVDEDDLNDWLRGELEIDFDALVSNYRYKNEKNWDDLFIVCADLGLWDGRRGSYGVRKGFTDMICSLFEDYNRVQMDDENGLVVEAIHHDGTNHFTIRKLTDEGEKYLIDDECDMWKDDYDSLKELFDNPKYSTKLAMNDMA